MQIGEFHHTNGWYFKRLADGSVQIRVTNSNDDDAVHLIPPNEWASIVAHVADGGSAEAYSAAEHLHAR